MAKTLINFEIGTSTVSNPDGTFSTTFTETKEVQGPGNTIFGDYTKAIDLGTSGKAVCDIAALAPNLKQFCINVVFNASGTVSSRQNIVESASLPFSIFLSKGSTADKFNLVTKLKPKNHNWIGPDTLFKTELTIDQWYAISLVYDYDTAALFIDGVLIGVHAVPNGAIDKLSGNKLYFGTWVDGSRDHFNGKLAVFQWYDGIPSDLESLLDEKRNHAEWFITHKYENCKNDINLGERTKKLSYLKSAGAHIQHYERGAVVYHPSIGTAFEMHGAIYERYNTLTYPEALGYLICDEVSTTKPGGRKSLFSRGGIYWSSATGAHPVTDKIYVEYENQGESKVCGFPINAVKAIPGGAEQEFENYRFYHKTGEPKANEVHGEILSKFLAIGGVSKWGFPISNESDVKKGNNVIGKFSEFEGCTIYWSGNTGAYEVHGDIRVKYREINGPLSDLGFPTSDESNIPNNSGAGRMNTFQMGSILWYGNFDTIKVARAFNIWIGRIDSRESEGFAMGQNDLYIKKLKVTSDGAVLHESRKPSSDDWGGKNIVNVDFLIPQEIIPNKIGMKVKLYLDIWESDPGDDDHMGTYEMTLDASNGWGLRENEGIYNVSFGRIRSLTWSVKPKPIAGLSEVQKWWGVANDGTDTITYAQYASAFKGVDSDTEWWDILDGLEALFYELVIKSLASGGNCFGMSLEGIYARKQKSIFALPLDRFTAWSTIRNEVNIKQLYQVGADPIWWFLGQFVSGNTHDPVDVFNRTHSEFCRGNHPVVCISQNYNFSGAPHCILPVRWDKSSKPWKMTILDPNFPKEEKVLTVNPDNNTFRYVGSETYTGGEWTGGRLHYMPFSILDDRQRLPVWDLIMLILAGTVIVLADDGETVSITDSEGSDLNAFGSRATKLLKAGVKPSEFFVGYNGFDTAIKPGQIFIRQEVSELPSTSADLKSIVNLPIAELTETTRIPLRTRTVVSDNGPGKIIQGRSAQHILADKESLSKLSPTLIKELEKIAGANAKRNYIHTVKGLRKGKLNYYVKSGWSELRLESSLELNETHKVEVNDLATNFCKVKMDSKRAKQLTIEVTSKLGVGGDYTKIRIENFAISPTNGLEINVKQGIAGIEILNSGTKTNLNVSISTRINKKDSTQSFVIPIDKGVRLKPSSVIYENELTISNIESIFGKAIQSYRMK